MAPTTPSPLAWERAFRLARAHGHLWAHSISDAVVAAYNSSSFEDAVRALRERSRDDDCRAPRSAEEARVALAAALVDCSFPSGIEPSLAHTTGTGRLSWAVAADGEVTLTVRRPAVAVAIEVSVGVNGGVLVHRAHAGVFAWRHVEALSHALRALGAEVPLVVALNADDDWSALADDCERIADDNLDAADNCDPARWPDEARAAERYLAAAEHARTRGEAFREWARLRRPVLRGGTPADYAAIQESVWSAQRALLSTLLGGRR